MKRNYVWKKQTLASNLESIDCSIYDPIKDFRMDPAGFYLLIRINKEQQLIEVAICNMKHQIIKVFKGKRSQDLYHSLFQHEKKYGVEWFKSKYHIVYLGKELKKAEYALSFQEEYRQE